MKESAVTRFLVGALLVVLLLGLASASAPEAHTQAGRETGPDDPLQTKPPATEGKARATVEPSPADPPPAGEIVMSQWVWRDDLEPMAFAEWLAQQPPPAPLHLELVYSSTDKRPLTTEQLVYALVNPAIVPGISESLTQWASDVEGEGWDVIIYSASFPDPPALRTYLAGIEGLDECLLIGDFPVPWYEIDSDEFPIDLFYMDLDGTWSDNDSDGMYDEHTGHTVPEIGLGRLTAGTLTYGGDEVALLNNYFAKNHAYRTGSLTLPSRALMYADDDWAGNGELWSQEGLEVLYPDTTVVYYPFATTGFDYRNRLVEGYEWIQVHAHANPAGQWFDAEVKVNFQTPQSQTPVGFEPDRGAVYDYRSAGLNFGWNADTSSATRERNTGHPLEYDTFIHMQKPENPDAYWEVEVPEGNYWVHVVAGDPKRTNGVYRIEVEGDLALDGIPTSEEPFVHGTVTVAVADGRLTIGSAPGAQNNRLAFVEIRVSEDAGWVSSREIYDIDPHAFFYNLYSCSASSYVYSNYVGGWYVFADTYGLAAVGTTKSGGMHGFHHFYGPLAHGEPLGTGFRNWFGLYGITSPAWHYGATLLGDPTLTTSNPSAELSPSFLEGTVYLGESADESLTISNVGNGVLSFELAEMRHKADRGSQRAGGGPDAFGYTYRDSNEVAGPTYQWIEIAPPAGGSGSEITELRYVDNGYFWSLPLPFTFNFYGTDYTDLTVASNGTLYFEDRYLGAANSPIPGANANNVDRFIAHFWDDLNVNSGGVYYQDLGSMFVIEYFHVFGTPIWGYGRWEAILFEDGNILFQYRDVDFDAGWQDYGRSATIGIQGNATTGLQYSYNTPALSDGLAVCFAYPGQRSDCSMGVRWLNADPTTGMLPGGGDQDIEVVFDASAPEVTEPGDYYSMLIVQSNDPDTPLIQLPVTMTVAYPASWGELEGTVASLGYCDEDPAPLASAEVLVQASTGLTWTLTTDDEGAYDLWLNASHSPLTVTATYTEHVMAQVTGVGVTAQITTAQDFDLRWLQPCIGVEPTKVAATLEVGHKATETLTISNRGAAMGHFALAEVPGGAKAQGSRALTPRPATARLHLGGQVYRAQGPKGPGPEGVGNGPPPLASGGPDPFGYTYKDSTEEAGPEYQWIEIAPPAGGFGTEIAGLSGGDDAYFWPLSMPFSFDFYGGDYGQMAVGTNGTLYFEDGHLGARYENVAIPGPNDSGVERFIAHWWDDLVIDPGAIYCQNLGSIFVVEYYQVSGHGSPDHGSWQAVLFDDGNILFQYQDVAFDNFRSFGASATVGIQGDEATGLQYAYNATALLDGLAICFAHPEGSPDCSWEVPWLFAEPLTGSVPADDSQTINVVLDASVPEVTDLGDYQAGLVIQSDDRQMSRFQVPVTMTVLALSHRLYLPLILREP